MGKQFTKAEIYARTWTENYIGIYSVSIFKQMHRLNMCLFTDTKSGSEKKMHL